MRWPKNICTGMIAATRPRPQCSMTRASAGCRPRSRYQAPVAMMLIPVVRKAASSICGQRTRTIGPVTIAHQSTGTNLPSTIDVAQRHLHPTVVGEDPERRQHGSERNHAAGQEIEPWRRAVAAKQHHAEERRLQHERGEAFVAEQRPLDRPGALRQHAPVGAELKRHDDSGDHAHAERKREHLQPEVEHAPIDRVAGRQPHPLEGRQPGGEPDGEGGKDDVETDDEGELDAREQYGVEVHSVSVERHRSCRSELARLRHQLALDFASNACAE